MTNSEVESTIAAAERAFDRKRDRVVELENALRGAENNLERSMVEHNRERIRTQIRRIEADLASARGALFDARTALDEAWALRQRTGTSNRRGGTKCANSISEREVTIGQRERSFDLQKQICVEITRGLAHLNRQWKLSAQKFELGKQISAAEIRLNDARERFENAAAELREAYSWRGGAVPLIDTRIDSRD